MNLCLNTLQKSNKNKIIYKQKEEVTVIATSFNFTMAPATGLEPIPTALDAVTRDLKSRVLPLHYAGIFGRYLRLR